MDKEKTVNNYFEFLAGVVSDDRFGKNVTYRRLLMHLHTIEFYANVAKHLGYDVPYDDEKHKFDCRKICITPSVYQKIKECYKQRFNDSELTVMRKMRGGTDAC